MRLQLQILSFLELFEVLPLVLILFALDKRERGIATDEIVRQLRIIHARLTRGVAMIPDVPTALAFVLLGEEKIRF